jgi:hypothetical protein
LKFEVPALAKISYVGENVARKKVRVNMPFLKNKIIGTEKHVNMYLSDDAINNKKCIILFC